ncbi:hypothetical protein SAMN04488564_10239 [Lentzea waywayandensis]|uniref:Uncharacterized protein n=1 Tax=Lentzea waywayandensis TaxID=84724 RepID=A0A1I6D9B9_9PSEU|nr:hypothetical protein [Lentzea waywayandensis]SFR02046.1 hypothetical protein SAMN04488564_10239 [Lentzea waywayandensis]
MGARSHQAAPLWIGVLPGVVALSAWAGAAGTAAGAVDFGSAVVSRLPFHSNVVAAVALVLIVALPMTFAAWLCLRNHPQWRIAVAAAGALLIGWIAVQLVVIRTFSWLQPIMALAGAAVLMSALAHRRNR